MRDAPPPGRPEADERCHSPGWHTGPPPAVSVLVSTYRRPAFLRELVAALEAQELDPLRFEVVVVDNGSGDETWPQLQALAAATPLRLLGLRLADNRGPGGARNQAAIHARAPVLAITDDDCLPTPGWVAAVEDAFRDDRLGVMQGRVEPPPDQWARAQPWDHTIWVLGPTPFFETCNVAYRRDAFESAGGFDEHDELFRPRSGRAFGEDARLAWVVQQHGGRMVFRDDAVVHHRVVPKAFRDHLRDIRHATGFPGLARRSPLVAGSLRAGVFLDGATAAFDLAVAGALLGAVTSRRLPLLLALPWARARWRGALNRTHGDRRRAVGVLGQYAVADTVVLASLLQGSARHRRLVA